LSRHSITRSSFAPSSTSLHVGGSSSSTQAAAQEKASSTEV